MKTVTYFCVKDVEWVMFGYFANMVNLGGITEFFGFVPYSGAGLFLFAGGVSVECEAL